MFTLIAKVFCMDIILLLIVDYFNSTAVTDSYGAIV